MTYAVVLPVLNERHALPWVLERMPAGFEPIVVDNGSTDGSGELAASLGAQVVREPRPGFGAACFAGLVAARADVVCFMDCDASFDPRELPLVAEPVAAGIADLVLGARVAVPVAAAGVDPDPASAPGTPISCPPRSTSGSPTARWRSSSGAAAACG